MKNMSMFLAGALIIGLLAGGYPCIGMGQAEAGDGFSYQVSCTIPAIPGVNVPFIEETSSTSTTLVQEETDGGRQGFLVRTLYEK